MSKYEVPALRIVLDKKRLTLFIARKMQATVQCPFPTSAAKLCVCNTELANSYPPLLNTFQLPQYKVFLSLLYG